MSEQSDDYLYLKVKKCAWGGWIVFTEKTNLLSLSGQSFRASVKEHWKKALELLSNDVPK